MKHTSTPTQRLSFKSCLVLLMVTCLTLAGMKGFAHRAEPFQLTNCTVGSTLQVDATIVSADGNTWYAWQYKDNTGTWKCFTASSVINGVTFTGITGISATGPANNAPTLSIPNATLALEGVAVRVLMRDGASPCSSPANSYGGDGLAPHEGKSVNLHVYANSTDCGANTPGCQGNFLMNGGLYYGGFEARTYNQGTDAYTDFNFGTSAAASQLSFILGSTNAGDFLNAAGEFGVMNNPKLGWNTFGYFAPHSGSGQMVVRGNATAASKVWYKSGLTVAAGNTYTFSAWAARVDGTDPSIQLNFTTTAGTTEVAYTALSTQAVGDWVYIEGQYTVPAGITSVEVSIRDKNAGTGANNYALDDICFKQNVLGSIGNRVWDDTDRDGVQDAAEVGVAGVTVGLFNSANQLIASVVTDAYGNYLFSGLPVSAAGINYQVRFSLPAQYVFTGQSLGGNATTDSDPVTTTGRTGNVALTTAIKDRTDIDAGIYYSIPARIGDFIWNDTDKDGVQDAGEPGIAGVTLTLYSGTTPVRTTVTDNNGYYLFTDVPVGTYTLGLTRPVGYILSAANVGDDSKDSDFDPATQKTATFNVTAGTSNLTYDGGMQVTSLSAVAAVGDKVWNDIDNDGLQDANEPGVAGVTVKLYTSAFGLVGTMITDEFGNYMFNNLNPGSYFVTFTTLPATFSFVAANVGGAANVYIDSDVTGANGTGSTATFTLAGGDRKITVDAGIRSSSTTLNSSLGDYVWYDLNKDGIQTANEGGVPGVTATLYNSGTGAIVKTTTTNANGFYLFTNLATGSYTVGFTNLPDGYLFTGKDLGGNDNTDSDVDPNSGRTGVYTIAVAGTNIYTVDGGIKSDPNVRVGKASIGDRVWNDITVNNIQDAGEPGVANVTVTLYAGNGTTVVATTTTDALGYYIFTNLDAGNYVVGFTLPSGYSFVTKDAGTNDGIDSDADATSGKTIPVTLAAGEVNLTLDAGIKATTVKASLGDRVWFDTDADGVQDAGELSAEGVTVTLLDENSAFIASTTTDQNGNYLFSNLDAGTYYLSFSNLPAGYNITTANLGTAATNSDPNVNNGKTTAIILTAGAVNRDWDMGLVTTSRSALGDYVWSDIDGDGVQDANEPGVGGITVTLYSTANVALASTVTDASGFYMFNNLTAATYNVGFSNIPANASFTTKNAVTGNAANTSDANTTGKTDNFVLAANTIKTDVDAGIVTLFAAVGDYVWYDLNANGRQDAGEPAVPGVTVKLYNGTTVVASAVTDGSGRYFINNIPVPLGGTSFTIGFSDLPQKPGAVITFTQKNASIANNTTNSDVNISNGRTDAFTLLPGAIDITIDAGLVTTGGTLPVVMKPLKGVYADAVSHLTWTTMQESSSSHFEILRSADGVNFSYLGTVTAKGTSDVQTDYKFNDIKVPAGMNYYRLKMVDRDGNFQYSNIVALKADIRGTVLTGVYPTPFVNRVNVSITSESNVQADVRLFDNSGKLVATKQAMLVKGVNTIVVEDLARLATGTYFIKVQAGDLIHTQQISK